MTMQERGIAFKRNREIHINNANDLKMLHKSKWLSLLGDSGWLVISYRKIINTLVV